MKVLIDATSTQDQFASRGPGRYTYEVISRMMKQSTDLGRDDTYYLLLFNSPTTLNDSIADNSKIVKTVNIGKVRASDKFNDIWWLTQIRPAIRRTVKEESPDVYFCPHFWRNFPFKLLPTVVMVHDFAFPVLNRYSAAPKYLDWIRKIQYHIALRRIAKCAGVITNSENTSKDLFKYVKKVDHKKAKAIYLGISEDIKKVNPDSDVLLKYLPFQVVERGYILYYAGIEPNKNVSGIIKSYSELLKRWEKYAGSDKTSAAPPFLVLAGGDFTRLDMRNRKIAELKFLIEDLGLEDYVYFTGFFEDEDLSDLLCGARMFIHLSLYEGFGFSVLEAMKCGLPVVASDRSCYPEVIGDGALLVDPEDPDKVADACFKVLTDKESAVKLSERALSKASIYTWDKTAKETYEYLAKVGRK